MSRRGSRFLSSRRAGSRADGLARAEVVSLRFFLSLLVAALVSTSAVARDVRHPAFVDAAAVADGLQLDIRYFGEHNFVGRRIDGYEAPRCLLTREAAIALAAVQRDLALIGLGLLVFDCYRPARAVAHFVRWAKNSADQTRKSEFYPEVDKRKLFNEGYIAARSGHSRGSTVDLTLVHLADGQALDMGSPFDFFGMRSWPSDRTVSIAAQANRRILARAMMRRGFRPYEKEWWHFTLANEPFPKTYFDFPVR
jgi:zinc D-Ala-D-Ala dipeptidase